MPEGIFSVPDSAPIIGGVYAHYKDRSREYKVTGVSLNSDTDEWHVEYIPLYEGAVAQKFNRALVHWLSTEIIDGKELERYQFVRII